MGEKPQKVSYGCLSCGCKWTEPENLPKPVICPVCHSLKVKKEDKKDKGAGQDLHYRQLNTILAALRMYQDPESQPMNLCDCEPLTNKEIDDLCEHLIMSGYFSPEPPKIIVEVTGGVVKGVLSEQEVDVMVVDWDSIVQRGKEFPKIFDFPVMEVPDILKMADELREDK